MSGFYPKLSVVLIEIYRAPSSNGGVERNHKVGKRVMSQLRCRMNETNVQKQVSIAHNNTQINRKVQSQRSSIIHGVLSTLCLQSFSQSEELDVLGEANDICDYEEEQWDDDQVLMDTSLLNIEEAETIPDALIFPDLDD